jgi:hypothetical protein
MIAGEGALDCRFTLHRSSGGGRDPDSRGRRIWIPAFAGMTGEGLMSSGIDETETVPTTGAGLTRKNTR